MIFVKVASRNHELGSRTRPSPTTPRLPANRGPLRGLPERRRRRPPAYASAPLTRPLTTPLSRKHRHRENRIRTARCLALSRGDAGIPGPPCSPALQSAARVAGRSGVNVPYALFLILDGTVNVHVSEEKLVPLGPGTFFGEMSLLDGGIRSATVVSETPTRLLVVNRQNSRSSVEKYLASPRSCWSPSRYVCVKPNSQGWRPSTMRTR